MSQQHFTAFLNQKIALAFVRKRDNLAVTARQLKNNVQKVTSVTVYNKEINTGKVAQRVTVQCNYNYTAHAIINS